MLIDRVRVVTLEQRHREALERRRVFVQHDEDGMAWTTIYGPAVEAQAISNRITTMAKRIKEHPDESRTLDQIRADVTGDLLIEGWTDAVAPEVRGIRASVAVTVPVLALLEDSPVEGSQAEKEPALDEAEAGESQEGESAGEVPPSASDSADGTAPRTETATRIEQLLVSAGGASVEGVGPIPMRLARQLCSGADGWMRVLTHPETGVVLSVGRDLYRPPPGLRRLVKWRSSTCMAPGCNQPADQCEIDHTVAWHDGGTTELENLAPLCPNHHMLKHHGNWILEQLPASGGVMKWTSPTGRIYFVEPERRVVAFIPDGEPAPF